MKSKRKPPKTITKTYLENAALHYLQRFATSSANFRKVMLRKVARSCKHHGGRAEDYAPLVDDLVARYLRSGLLDDEAYARAKTATLRRQGKSGQAIHAKLQSKGLSKPEVAAALGLVDEDDEEAEFRAALALAKKKKLGPFRLRPADPKKEMAAMGRAGFSYDVARRALEYEEEETRL